MKARIVGVQGSNGMDSRVRGSSAGKTPQGRQVEANSSCESAWKVAKIGLVLLGITALVYWSVCDMTKHDFCIPNNLTDIALNLDKVASLF